MKTTTHMLDELAELLNEATGLKFEVKWAYGEPRLERRYISSQGIHVSEEVSPRLKPGRLHEWMQAYYKGIQIGINVEGNRWALKQLIKQGK